MTKLSTVSHRLTTSSSPSTVQSTSASAVDKEKCWFFENGYCREGGKCSWSHPSVMCGQFWSQGECYQDEKCPQRHPIQVCTKYLDGSCFSGKNCVHQHPEGKNQSPNPTKVPPSPMMNQEPRSSLYPGGFYPFQPNVQPVPTPPHQPTAPTRMSGPPAQSPVYPTPQQQHSGYGEQYQQGNEHSHLGQ